MTDAGFPGSSQYFARLEAWYSGYRVYGRLTVFKTSGTGYYTLSPVSYGAHAAGAGFDGSWTYDFRNYGSKVVAEWSQPVSGPGNYVVDAWVDMAGFGRADPGGITVSIPPNAPRAPGKPSVDRAADNNIAVNWRDEATNAAPYEALQVQRQMYDGNWRGWVGVADDIRYNGSTGDRGFGDYSGVPNRIYTYRIKVSNSAGEAYSPEASWVFTTPGAPGGVSATKQSSGSIVIAWNRGTPHTEIVTDIDYSTNGGTSWTSLVTGIAASSTSYTMSTPPAGSSIKFRLRHRTISNDPNARGVNLPSAWSESNSVGLTAPPLAPSALDPNGLAFDAAAAKTFGWQHNTADSSTQTAYEIQYRIGSAAWTTTGKVASTTSARQFPANAFVNGNSYQWQVRTWGAHADPSPWSATATFSASASPSVVITAPAATLELASVTAAWTYTDPEGTAQSAWEAELLRGGQVIEQKSGSGAASSVAFATRLDDANAYQVRVRVRDGSLLWSAWDQRSFTTSFPSPAVPLVITSFNADTGMATISVVNQTVAGKPAVVQNVIMRSEDEGRNWTQITTAPPNGIAFDPTIPLAKDVLYKAVAESALPSFAESVPQTVNSEYTPWAVELTNLALNPSMERAQAGNTVVRRNLVTQPVFLTGAVSGWTRRAFSTSNLPFVDNGRLAINVTSGGGGAYAELGSLPAGSLAVQTLVTTPEGSVAQIRIYETVTQTWYFGSTSQQGTAVLSSVFNNLPAGTYRLYLVNNNTGMIYFDQICAEQVPAVLPFFYGGTVDDTGLAYSWEGAVEASPSVAKATAGEVRRNLFGDPRATKTSSFGSHANNTHAAITTSALGPTAVRSTRVATGATRWLDFVVGSSLPANSPVSVMFRIVSSVSQTISVSARYQVGTSSNSVTLANLVLEAGVARDISLQGLSSAGAVGSSTGIALTGLDGAIGDWIDVTGVVVENSAISQPYFDGYQTPDADLVPSWTGTPDASPSILSGVAVGKMGTSAATYTVRSLLWAASGQASLRIMTRPLAGTNRDSYSSVGGADVGALRLGMQPGKSYTVLGTARFISDRVAGEEASIRSYTRVGTGSYATLMSSAPRPAGVYQIRQTFNVPEGATEAFIRLYNGGNASSADVWWDDVMVVEGIYEGPYFDGNSIPENVDVIYGWDSTKNDSISTKTTRKFIGSDGGYWTAGSQFNEVVRMRRGQGAPPKIDLQTSVAQKTLQYFAGRTHPVELAGLAESRIGTVEFVVTSEDQMWQARRMALLPAPHLFRLPDHTHIFASMGPMSDTRLADGWYKLSFTITEVEQ